MIPTRLFRPLMATATRHTGRLRALTQARDASVSLIAAMALLPTLFGLGFTIDYARAEMLQSQVNAAADAAALAATDDLYLRQDWDTVAKAQALQIFTSQVANYPNFVFDPVAGVNITHSTSGALNLGRSVTVAWQGKSTNLFGGILGISTLSIGGASQSSATEAPNMNFFLVMDKSPSMLLPTTSTGIAAVQAASADKCAFACHQQAPGANYIKDANGRFVFLDQNYYTTGSSTSQVYYLYDSTGNNLYASNGTLLGAVKSQVMAGALGTISYTYSTTTTNCNKNGKNCKTTTTSNNSAVSGYWADGYWLTHNYTKVYPSGSPIDLRVNDETLAAQQLIPYATSQESVNKVVYQLQFFSYDWTHLGKSSPVTQYSAMQDVNGMPASAVPDLDGTQDYWYVNSMPTAVTNINDQATENNNMLTSLNKVMPAPGDGSTPSHPQEVMLLITDGVSDENINGSRTNREFNATDIASCTAIKNRGIKIAILYTLYDPDVIKTDGWSNTNVVPYLPNVLPALQSCASAANDGSPLVYTVQSGQSISTALQSLFKLTIANSHLVG